MMSTNERRALIDDIVREIHLMQKPSSAQGRFMPTWQFWFAIIGGIVSTFFTAVMLWNGLSNKVEVLTVETKHHGEQIVEIKEDVRDIKKNLTSFSATKRDVVPPTVVKPIIDVDAKKNALNFSWLEF